MKSCGTMAVGKTKVNVMKGRIRLKAEGLMAENTRQMETRWGGRQRASQCKRDAIKTGMSWDQTADLG